MPTPTTTESGAEQQAVEEQDVDQVEQQDDVTPPEATDWWKFDDKDAAEKWANNLVTKRLARERKNNVDPIVAERDTLKAEVEELRPLRDATKTDSERWEGEKASLVSELDELRAYKAEQTRLNLVREIAAEEGLPAAFLARVGGTDEDEIREDIKDLLNALSEGGSNTKQAPKPKAPKETRTKDSKTGHGGGGSDDEDLSHEDILKQLAERRGNPFTLRH